MLNFRVSHSIAYNVPIIAAVAVYKHKCSILKPKYMKSTGVQKSTTPAIVGNNVLSPVVVEALQSDAHLKELYKRLSEIHLKAFPIVVQVSPTEFKASYSDEVNELIAKVHQEINFRQEQILSFYNR